MRPAVGARIARPSSVGCRCVSSPLKGPLFRARIGHCLAFIKNRRILDFTYTYRGQVARPVYISSIKIKAIRIAAHYGIPDGISPKKHGRAMRASTVWRERLTA